MRLRRLMSSPEPRTGSVSGAAPTGVAGTAHLIPETTARSSIRPLAPRSTGLHGSVMSDARQHAGAGGHGVNNGKTRYSRTFRRCLAAFVGVKKRSGGALTSEG
jgi:hypothetical protein